jgi:hypothetical protein
VLRQRLGDGGRQRVLLHKRARQVDGVVPLADLNQV